MPISRVRCDTENAKTALKPVAVIKSATNAKRPSSRAVTFGEAIEALRFSSRVSILETGCPGSIDHTICLSSRAIVMGSAAVRITIREANPPWVTGT